eukprot:719865-Ditylum_brightwellii.AAC.1
MSAEAFDALLDAIEEGITLSFVQSACLVSRNKPIYSKLILAMGLRFLVGDSVRTLSHLFGVSKPTARCLIYLVLDAIDSNTRFGPIQVHLLVGGNEVQELAERWQAVLTAHCLFDGHLGTLDEWLPRSECPRGIQNQADYFS